MEINDKIIERLDRNIEASNRTTHAVRAFVRFLFIQLTSLTLAAGIFLFGQLVGDPASCLVYGTGCGAIVFFNGLAIVVWIGGVIWSSARGWEELGKSEVRELATNRIAHADTAPTSSPEPVYIAPTSYSGDEKLCKGCGWKVSSRSDVCRNCGTNNG